MKDKVINDLLKKISDLEFEVERLDNNNQALQKEMARTWEKLDKANNIIKKAKHYIMLYYYDDLYDDTLTAFEDTLLDILKGVDKE